MTTTTTMITANGLVTAGDGALWVDQRGEGPDVLLIAGLGDPAEAWNFQLEGLANRYRLTAFDNRGAGRSPAPPDGFTVIDMADDAAALLRSLGAEHAHVLGFSGGSATAQHLALRHPDLVRSLVLMSTWGRGDAFFRTMLNSFAWLPEMAPSGRAMLEAFFLFVYTPRAHDSGMVDQIIEDALAFPHQPSPEAFRRQVEAWIVHDTLDLLHEIGVPTLVLAGEVDILTPPRYGRAVAERIPDAQFVVLPGEAHQPFQESPDEFNAIVDAFWAKIDRRDAAR